MDHNWRPILREEVAYVKVDQNHPHVHEEEPQQVD